MIEPSTPAVQEHGQPPGMLYVLVTLTNRLYPPYKLHSGGGVAVTDPVTE